MLGVSCQIQCLHRILIQVYPTDSNLFVKIVGAIRSDVQSDAIDSVSRIGNIHVNVFLVHRNMLERRYNQFS
ncbi:hypothetical protein VI03_28345 [Burkholderia vietnamiensis]|uniref:Uncharacterized protein n=1 Tax=Burkholderia ubonensis TaxID=101571 RepID=A0A1B4L9H7_9BURK|nr:hypothetical protein WJ35_01140 [Burkholderia ubonensis]AOK00761.1 hypothetical protein WK23_20210 [Burkholderia vietnamiensis]AOK10613.1 hypothetical protein WK31_10415 [Burkholderia vietnamiensis]KKI35425.1 hypothetical protein VI03_28345 [Burkholderia vietnamiensis]KVD98182.1 hypothetical protein WI91_03350 [Burkholderia vietnamiensis]